MTNFEQRIIQPDGRNAIVPFVDLDDQRGEDDLYHGCGRVIIEVDDGEILDINYLHSLNDEQLFNILKRAGMGGEFWLAMASCYQLCEPVRLRTDDPEAFARAIRVHADISAPGVNLVTRFEQNLSAIAEMRDCSLVDAAKHIYCHSQTSTIRRGEAEIWIRDYDACRNVCSIEHIYGQESVKRAMEIAAAGDHTICLTGSDPAADYTVSQFKKALASIAGDPGKFVSKNADMQIDIFPTPTVDILLPPPHEPANTVFDRVMSARARRSGCISINYKARELFAAAETRGWNDTAKKAKRISITLAAMDESDTVLPLHASEALYYTKITGRNQS